MDLKRETGIKEMKDGKDVRGKKYDGFAIASFVLSLVGIIFFDYDDIFVFGHFDIDYSHVILLFSFIFAIISLIRIKKNKNLRGRVLAIIAVILSSLFFILSILAWYNISGLPNIG